MEEDIRKWQSCRIGLRNEEIIGEWVLIGVQSDAPLDSNAAPGASVSESPNTDNDPLPGKSGIHAPTSNAFADTAVAHHGNLLYKCCKINLYEYCFTTYGIL